MIFSVIICTYQTKRYIDLLETIKSVNDQTIKDIELIVVVDGNLELYKKLKLLIKEKYLILNDKNLGLSRSKNVGIKKAIGDIITFLDDDAVADKNWLSELKKMYNKENAIAAGGKLVPLWITPKPKLLPEEYYWLIGATYKGFQTKMCEVRNTFGSNISFKAEILNNLKGFRGNMGFKSGKLMQGEETELCDRMKKMYGKGVMYNPDAIVYHKVFSDRIKYIKLMKRCFWQGYSKRVMKEHGHKIKEESNYLKHIITGTKERLLHPSLTNWIQLVSLFLFTSFVGLGYGYKIIKRKN